MKPRPWALALVFALAAAVCLGWLVQTTRAVRSEARERFFEQYNQQQLLLATQASRTVEELFDKFRRDLGLVASLFQTDAVKADRIEAVKSSLVKIYESLDSTLVYDLALFDRSGTVVWSYPPSPGTVGTNLAWRDYFQWARDHGRPGEIYLTSWIEMKAGSVRGQRALIVASGIYGEGRTFKGLAIFAVNFDAVARKYVLSVKIGQDGYAWLADTRNRTVLVDPTGRVNGRTFEEAFLPRWPQLFELLTRAQDGRPGTGWYEYEDPENPSVTVRKLVGHAPIRVGDRLWVLGVATPEREVDALLSSFLRRQETFSTAMGAAILVAAVITCGLLVAWNRTLSRRVGIRTRDLAETRAELLTKNKLAAVGQMALGLTHEIRNPLSAIRMNVQMIREESPAAGELGESFDIVESEIRRLNRLLDDVMGFARPRPLRLAKTDLRETVQRVLRLAEQVLAEERVAVEVRADAGVGVTCDPEQIQQVLWNLILNAVESMREVAGPRQLTVGVKVSGGAAALTVSDTGVGVRPEDRERIFDPFFTTKAQGGGLGLATIQSIVLRHGGSVDVQSDGAGGATFTVRLPLDGPPSAEGNGA